MRRVLTTLMILLVVLVAGLSALVLLVNPNDFRAYMVRQVEARSGYQLQLDGPLRWHVWPQLSILSGRMTLTAPGAQTPVVAADNMRLDVNLWPLLSHQLHVKQVMLKGAVIQLTPQSAAAPQKGAPVAPRENNLPQVEGDRGWSWDIASLQVVDSLLVFQHDDDEQLTVRDIRLQMEQDSLHQAKLDFAGRINRNQRDLTLSFSAQVDARDYPHNLTAAVDNLKWQLQGGDVPTQGIEGEGRLQAQWQRAQQRLTLNDLSLRANDTALTGNGSVTFGNLPVWALDLQFDSLNLDNLLPPEQTADNSGSPQQQGQAQNRLPRPVISTSLDAPEYNGLRSFTAQIGIRAKSVRWRGMQFADVVGQFNNNAGLLSIPTLQGKMGNGEISLPGELDVRGEGSLATFQPKLDNVEIGTILKAFNYPIALTGSLSMAGDFSGPNIDAEDFRRHWQGEAHVDLKNSRMEGLNFQQLVQQAVARSSDVQAQENYDNATRLDSFTSDVSLDKGLMKFSDMQGSSALLSLTGEGEMDLLKEQADTRFEVRVMEGWKGQSELIDFLKNTPVPLRVYGKWQALNYSLQVDQLLRKHLQDEAKRRLNDWADRNKDRQSGKDVKKLLEKM
ncbi:outer membrane assembly protein AsmA [Kosakonia pseudosacchari]|uniref:outer membrane assembly protein AsmA n=1 Tax=Kosakonia pseudosacchari TaxID=1646340 RepID=UPI000A3AE66B|nr:outer membrane assembly protein AsmA [Kosakonia pseudosacchari]QOV62520.1 outer membrane assembly protein AsmA [Kosakonia pseudosacchari]WBU50936.1 outer membrane assembly protein AsmA [Kosakonia pseudosacchari]